VFTDADDRPIFIGGCPRSGTTLLRTMLNTHPDIAIPRETRIVPYVWDNRSRWRDLDDVAVREQLVGVIGEVEWTRADRFETPMDELNKRLMAAPPTLGSILGTCFVLYAEATGKRRWGDKRPMYARYLDAVFSLFPDAQYINVVRDPRGSIASMRKIGWYDGRVAPALDLCLRSLHAVDPWRKALRSDQYFDLRYEDLVVDPEQALTRLAAFLKLSPESVSVMLTYHEHVDETSTRYHPHLTEPINDEQVSTWRDDLDDGEINFIEQETAHYLDQFGYERVTAGAHPSTLVEDYETYRREIADQRRLIEREEMKRRVVYRQPVAARLTSGEQLPKARSAMPPFRQRHLGKPR
jgi:hypothetical protein